MTTGRPLAASRTGAPCRQRLGRAAAMLAGAAVFALGLPPTPASAQAAGATPRRPRHEDPAGERNKAQAERRDLQARLEQLRERLAASESAHSEVRDALRASESAISQSDRRLHELSAQRGAAERQLAQLHELGNLAAHHQTAQERALGSLLRAQLTAAQSQAADASRPGSSATLEAAFADDTAFVYSAYLVTARASAIDSLRGQRAEYTSLASQIDAQRAALEQIANEEASGHQRLLGEQAARRKTLAALSRQIGEQRHSVASMERDEHRLSALVDELARTLAQHPAVPAHPARPAPEPDNSRPANATPRTGEQNTVPVEPPGNAALTRFARQRGHLHLPVAGVLAGRFGSSRLGDDGTRIPGSPSWKGVFIRAAAGTEVHAVAAGRVVFADWLRGFGNLLIVDHGEGFLSVYGFNQSLLRSVGDQVAADDVIAAVGNSGGNAESGLYFEMRFEGRPFDPLAWASAR